jgi:hypothetical protein
LSNKKINTQNFIDSPGAAASDITGTTVEKKRGLDTNILNTDENSIPSKITEPIDLSDPVLNFFKEELEQLKELILCLSEDERVIKDGEGGNFKANVSSLGALRVSDQKLPTDDPKTLMIPFKGDLANSAGATDMRVDGSTTNVDFVVEADQEFDVHIHALSFRIADVGATMNNFGNIGALTNGCQLLYSDISLGEVIIGDSLQSNFDFVRMANGQPAFGDGASAFRITNAVGNSEGYIPILDLDAVFGLPWGVRLRRGSTEKLILRVRDDVTGVDAFDCVAFGFKKLV